jgi:sugar phosphate isomerase/epimerase
MFRIKKEFLFFHAPYHIFQEAFDLFAANGLNPEIYCKQHELDVLSDGDIAAVREKLAQHGLLCTFHSPFLDLNPGSADEKIRTVSLTTLLKSLRTASLLGAKTAVIHTGFSPIYYGGFHSGAWYKRALHTFEELTSYAASKNIFLALENSLEPDPRHIIDLIEKIDSQFFRACVDVGHLHAFGKGTLMGLLKKYPKDSIREVHLSDNKGDEDSHLALGTGGIAFTEIFDYFDKNDIAPYVTIEAHCKEDIPHSIAFLEKNGFLAQDAVAYKHKES